MAICKDCLHYELCVRLDDVFKYFSKDHSSPIHFDTKRCDFFKDKSRFVEIVRCSECKYFDIEDDDALGICVGKFICVSLGGVIYPEPNHYCSYGERRSEE